MANSDSNQNLSFNPNPWLFLPEKATRVLYDLCIKGADQLPEEHLLLLERFVGKLLSQALVLGDEGIMNKNFELMIQVHAVERVALK